MFDFATASQYEAMLGNSTLRIVHEKEGNVPCLPTGSNGSKHVGVPLITPKPDLDDLGFYRMKHTYPAYHNSILKLKSTDIKQAQSYMPSYNYFGATWSGFKNMLGTPGSLIKMYLSDDLIERTYKGESEA